MLAVNVCVGLWMACSAAAVWGREDEAGGPTAGHRRQARSVVHMVKKWGGAEQFCGRREEGALSMVYMSAESYMCGVEG